jgi:hypothetical protein
METNCSEISQYNGGADKIRSAVFRVGTYHAHVPHLDMSSPKL